MHLFLVRETIFMTSCLLSCIPVPFWKGDYSKRKEFAPPGEQILSFKSRPYFRRKQKQFWKSKLALIVYLFSLKALVWGKRKVWPKQNFYPVFALGTSSCVYQLFSDIVQWIHVILLAQQILLFFSCAMLFAFNICDAAVAEVCVLYFANK